MDNDHTRNPHAGHLRDRGGDHPSHKQHFNSPFRWERLYQPRFLGCISASIVASTEMGTAQGFVLREQSMAVAANINPDI